MLDELEKKLGNLNLSSTKESTLQYSNPKTNQISSNIFLTKKFNSLSSKKLVSKQNKLGTPPDKKLDRNFLNDTPIAVNDKRWSQKKPFSIGLPIENPMTQNDAIDPKENIQFITCSAGFKKHAKEESPFKDPYSILNNSRVERTGASFLDNPSQYGKEQELADKLIKSLDHDNDAREIKKLENKKIVDKDRKVKGLSVNLLDHQVHGLKFLRKREKEDVLKKGGLLCDDMGLGKTVQTLALIVKNGVKDDDNLKNYDDIEDVEKAVPLRKFRGTLVICPVSLISQWNQEIKKFTPHLKTTLFHGPNRAKSYKELKDADIIVSSYDTLRSEFSSGMKNSPLYQGFWHRIVLDEAHVIKNSKSKTAIAAYNLESLRRWCLTGTPIQNSIDELQSLFQFLRVTELTNPIAWKMKVSNLIKKGESNKAFTMLKKELDMIMLRRTKTILKTTNFKLPEKRIHITEIDFSETEKQLYEYLSSLYTSKVLEKFTETKKKGKEISLSKVDVKHSQKLSPKKLGINNDKQQSNYMYALVCLLRLRQLCCHSKLLTDFTEKDIEDLNKPSGNTPTVLMSERVVNIGQEMDDLTSVMSSLTVKDFKCEICLVEKVKPNEMTCDNCSSQIQEKKKTESAKVLKLIEILQKEKTRKTIVFSQFRELLVLLGTILKSYGIGFVMYDGKMNIKQKDIALEKLRSDRDTTVLLCSLKSGAVGLNLTAASQVVMFDPWWNPQIQEQAIDRVYRIGQTREVDVYIFAVKDTVEIGILKLQETKKKLAKAVIDNDDTSGNSLNALSQSELMKLFGM